MGRLGDKSVFRVVVGRLGDKFFVLELLFLIMGLFVGDSGALESRVALLFRGGGGDVDRTDWGRPLDRVGGGGDVDRTDWGRPLDRMGGGGRVGDVWLVRMDDGR